ncbi:hypothetical protein [Achromobacter sp. DH1f]|uniref:hypothetical protein n=1 Tax=Achromobacter sp. DH1f TaxID=1397275 RepID=UPI0012FED1AA|nr:hypothetical protein [Achromobacter sp. DH1f]
MKDLLLSIRRAVGGRAGRGVARPPIGASENAAHAATPATCAGCGITTAQLFSVPGGGSEQTRVCELCASYSAVGEKDPLALGRDLNRHSLVAILPELAVADVNLLHWAMSLALQDPVERDRAQQVSQRLQARLHDTKSGYGSMRAQAFGEAMAYLSDGQYAMRDVSELRLVFAPKLLEQVQSSGSIGLGEYADCGKWDDLTRSKRRQVVEGKDADGPGKSETLRTE